MSTAVYQAQYRKDRILTGYRRVDATGTRRRIQALMAIGWTARQIATATGLNNQIITLISSGQTGDRVYRSTALRIALFYEPVSMRVQVAHTAAWMRAYARRRGYAPPVAWDNIDDVTEQPKGVAA